MKPPSMAFLLLLGPGVCLAQLDPLGVEPDCINVAAASSAPALMIEDSVAGRFIEARSCLQYGDARCAEDAIAGLDPESLNDDEKGALALLRGDIEALGGDRFGSEREYEMALELPVVHPLIERAAVERLAILDVRGGLHEQALQRLEGLECGEWSPDMLFLVASAQYGVEEYERSFENVQIAIDTRLATEGPVPVGWFSLRAAAVQQLEGVSSDELICQIETPMGSLIPVERCYTREEMQETSTCQSTARARQSIGQIMDCYPR